MVFDNIEKKLMNIGDKERLTPDNIDEYIKKGIKLGQKRKKKLKVRFMANVAVLMVIAVFLTSIRVSPVFADYAAKVPGLEYIVNLINYDKGIKEAVDNNFVQRVNASQEQQGLVVTIKDMIIDSSKAVIFYSIENKTNHRFVNLDKMSLKDENGNSLKAGVYWNQFINKDMSKEKKLEEKVELDFTDETVLPDKLYIEVKLKESDSAGSSMDKWTKLTPLWKFEIPIDKKRLESMKKVYTLNQNAEVEGQKILFKTITITPIRISVDVEYNNDNTKKILHLDDLAIYNEKGEKWASITNGISGSRIDDNHETLYFQSNYFKDSSKLYLKGNSIRAVDKDKLTVLVDVENKKLLRTPDDRLTLEAVSNQENGTVLVFNLMKDKLLDEKYSYFVFSQSIMDSAGKVLESTESYSRSDFTENKQQEIIIIPNNVNFKSPIKLTIQDYPSRIKGDFSIRIK